MTTIRKHLTTVMLVVALALGLVSATEAVGVATTPPVVRT